VHRGQILGHVTHYWSGATKTIDWHHLHWGMRKGKYDPNNIGAYVRGYAKKNEFTIDPATGVWTHSEWVDPFTIVAANSDQGLAASADVRHHPPGSLLEDASGSYWLVMDDAHVSNVSLSALASDRFSLAGAVHVSDAELACYAISAPFVSQGHITLYVRPNSPTVVMAYDATHTRYDIVRWEALLSWGYDASDLSVNPNLVQQLEATYAPKGLKKLRPGTLVKADESPEVSIVTMANTRRAITSAEVFEALGFSWERVVSIPQSVIDQVAGPKEQMLIDETSIHACNAPQKQNQSKSGVHFLYSGPPLPGSIKLEGWWQPPNAPSHGWGIVSDCVDTIPGDGTLECELPLPSGTSPFEFQIDLPNGSFWGDQSCSSLGGCGKPNGTVKLSNTKGPIPVTLVPNNTNNQPYYNGHVQLIP
jgi:hypothetical protein